MQWDIKGTGLAAGEGILYGIVDKVLKDQDATATPAPRTDPIKSWSGYFRIGSALVSGVVQATMPKYKDLAAPITGASFAFLTQSVWAYANARGAGARVTYVPTRTGAPARRVAGPVGGFAQEGVSDDKIVV